MKSDERTPLEKTASLPRIEWVLAWLLRGGVLISATLIALGLAMEIPGASSAYDVSARSLAELLQGRSQVSLEMEGRIPRTVARLWAGLSARNGDAMVVLGLLLLIALPIVRVAVTLVMFLMERDWAYVGITLIVLSVLFSGMILGKVH